MKVGFNENNTLFELQGRHKQINTNDPVANAGCKHFYYKREKQQQNNK